MTVKGKFEACFVKRNSTVFERAKFKQEEGESVNELITDFAEHRGYRLLHDELVRDCTGSSIIACPRSYNLTSEEAVTKVSRSSSNGVVSKCSTCQGPWELQPQTLSPKRQLSQTTRTHDVRCRAPGVHQMWSVTRSWETELPSMCC